jgi:GGDEF domain-containing protein
MQILARAAASLSDPGAAPDAIEQLLDSIPAEAGLPCDLRLSDGILEVTWHESPGPEQQAFVDVLAECVTLAGTVSARAAYSLLDARGFAAELGRVTAAARWRGHDASLAVFDVEGVAHGPGVDESDMVAHVGALARSAVRSNDIVGHLGAGRFALLLPRAGSFEARSAYRRVRTAVAASEYAANGISCGHAGFSELNEGTGEDMLMVAVQRLTDAQRRTAYEGPWDPTHPLAG